MAAARTRRRIPPCWTRGAPAEITWLECRTDRLPRSMDVGRLAHPAARCGRPHEAERGSCRRATSVVSVTARPTAAASPTRPRAARRVPRRGRRAAPAAGRPAGLAGRRRAGLERPGAPAPRRRRAGLLLDAARASIAAALGVRPAARSSSRRPARPPSAWPSRACGPRAGPVGPSSAPSRLAGRHEPRRALGHRRRHRARGRDRADRPRRPRAPRWPRPPTSCACRPPTARWAPASRSPRWPSSPGRPACRCWSTPRRSSAAGPCPPTGTSWPRPPATGAGPPASACSPCGRRAVGPGREPGPRLGRRLPRRPGRRRGRHGAGVPGAARRGRGGARVRPHRAHPGPAAAAGRGHRGGRRRRRPAPPHRDVHLRRVTGEAVVTSSTGAASAWPAGRPAPPTRGCPARCSPPWAWPPTHRCGCPSRSAAPTTTVDGLPRGAARGPRRGAVRRLGRAAAPARASTAGEVVGPAGSRRRRATPGGRCATARRAAGRRRSRASVSTRRDERDLRRVALAVEHRLPREQARRSRPRTGRRRARRPRHASTECAQPEPVQPRCRRRRTPAVIQPDSRRGSPHARMTSLEGACRRSRRSAAGLRAATGVTRSAVERQDAARVRRPPAERAAWPGASGTGRGSRRRAGSPRRGRRRRRRRPRRARRAPGRAAPSGWAAGSCATARVGSGARAADVRRDLGRRVVAVGAGDALEEVLRASSYSCVPTVSMTYVASSEPIWARALVA